MLDTENTFKEHGPQPNWEGKQAWGVCGSMFHVTMCYNACNSLATSFLQ